MLKFTVVVPVYNTPFEVYKECMDSIASCLGDSDEMIIVDDGSNVDYYRDYKTYVSENASAKFIRTENMGVSSARNTALPYASGNYIVFVDSDDILVKDCLNEIRGILQKSPVDLLCFESIKGEKYQSPEFVQADRMISIDLSEKSDLIKAAFLYSKKYNYLGLNTIWGKAYRRELIEEHSINFPIGLKRMEDVMFNVDFLECTNTMSYSNKVFYFYRTGTAFSAVNSFQDEYLVRFSSAFSEFDAKYNSDSEIKTAIEYKKFVILLDYINKQLCDGRYSLSQAVNRFSSLLKESCYKECVRQLQYKDLLNNKERIYLLLLKRKLYGIIWIYCRLKNR